jgi:hypothetical protein
MCVKKHNKKMKIGLKKLSGLEAESEAMFGG